MANSAARLARMQHGVAWRWRSLWRRMAYRFERSMMARGGRLADLYLMLFDRELIREARAVYAGRRQYAVESKSNRAPSLYLLRRNIHRLEKGLIMRPRRPVFARAFIEETVDIYALLLESGVGLQEDEAIWARDVLKEYFAVVDRTADPIAKAFDTFSALPEIAESTAPDRKLTPFQRDLSGSPPVDPDAFFQLCMRRRSVRWYRPDPVPRDIVDTALAAAVQAPTACNRQPFHYRMFEGPDLAPEIASIPMGTKGFAHQLPGVAVLIGQLRAYPFARDRHAIYVDASLSAMSFMLAMETQGCATCPINWPDHEPYETIMRERLNLADDERVIMLIGYGWPDVEGHVPRSVKRSVANVRSYEA